MLRRYALTLALIAASVIGRATHFSGGEIYWHCLGNNQYEITLMVYRDCAGINVDPTVTLQLTSPCGNTSITVAHSGPTEISQLCSAQLPNSTCNGGTLPGIQQYVYTGIVTLAPCVSWTISYTNIYRNNAIMNLVAPGTQRTHIRAVVNTLVNPCNDSPQFSNTAIPFVCLGYPVTYSFGAWDPEGDSLSYELINAMGLNGAPIPYSPPYTYLQPITGLTLDPLTGEVNFTLNLQGNWVVVVRVNHWVNGVLVGSVMRDMQFVGYPCANDPPDPATGVVTGLTGNAVQLGPRAVQVCESGDFCFNFTINDPNLPNVLQAFSNIGQSLPGATFTYTAGNPLSGQVCWTAQPGTAGFYPFIVNVDDGACPIPAFQTYIYSITVIEGLYGTVTTTGETCLGTGNGTATANVTAGTAPFTYAWSTGATTPSIMAGPGTYTVTMTDANNCESPVMTGVIGTESLPNQANAGPDAVGCVGSFPITLAGSVVNATGGNWSGGNGAFAGTWPSITYAPTAAEIAAGSVTLTLTTTGNANCPPASDSMLLQIPNSFAGLSLTSTSALCPGGSTGTASVVNGLPGFTYQWSTTPVQTGPTASGLSAGTYGVIITDNFNCSTSQSVSVTEPQSLSVSIIAVGDESCAGFADGTITASASGGTAPYTYTWSNGATGALLIAGAGTYTVSVTDANSCGPATATATINASAQPNIADAGADLIGCVGSFPIALNGNVTNATGGAWTGGTGNFSGAWPAVSYTPSAADIAANGVTLTLTTTGNAACPPTSDAVFINIPNSFANATVTPTDAVCFGTATGSAAFSPDLPGFTYAWTTVPVQTAAVATGLAAGSYDVTATDAYGCTISLSTSIGPVAALSIASLSATDETCAGFGNGTATVVATGGTAPYSYLWSTGSNATSITAGAGSYTVTVTDANNCAPVSGTIAINASAQPNQADAGPDLVGCVGSFPIALVGSVTNATGGSWSGNGSFTGTWPSVSYTPTASEIAANSATLTLTTTGNSNCPAASDQVTINIPDSFDGLSTTTVNAPCNGQTIGSASVTPVVPGLSYLWNDPGAQTTPVAVDLAAGDYSVIVSDDFGCSVTLNATVTQPAPILISSISSTPETCAGFADGTATVSASGGTPPYSYLWDNGGTTASITTVAGDYVVGVTDVNGCAVAVGFITIDALAQPNQANAGPDQVACMGDYPISLTGSVVNATGGVWSGGNGTWLSNGMAAQYMPSNGEIANGGVALVLMSVGNTLCPAASDTVVISLSNAFIGAGLTPSNVDCNGNGNGSIVFAPDVAGNSYAWNDPMAQVAPTAIDLGPGAYTLTITDSLGCDTSLTAVITEPAPLTITSFNTTNVTCNGGNNGTAYVLVAGGTPQYTYAWSGGQMTPAITALQAGAISVTITDANGCTAQADSLINEPAPLSFMAVVPDTVCVNAPVVLTAQATGGTGTLTYNWGPLGTGNPIAASFTQSQNVQLSVSDQNGCVAPAQFYPVTVLNLSTATLTAYGDTTICPGGAPATVGAQLGNYPGTYTIIWPELGSTGSGPYNVPFTQSQTLHVIVTDQCGNTRTDSVALIVETPPAIDLPPIIAQGCAPLTVTFPDLQLGPNLSYQWNLGNGSTSVSPQPILVYQAGTYNVSLTVSTPAGCTSSSATNGVINAWLPPTAAFSASTYNTTADNAEVSFTDQSQGSIATWSWTFGDGGTSGAMNPTYVYGDVGTFEVALEVTDVHGCSDEAEAVITITPVHDIVIPTAFTPTGNGNGGYYDPNALNNDVFYAFVRYVKDFRMRVFNRWGELVFESEDVRYGWDGQYKGQLSPQDVYVVQTWVRFVDGKEKQLLTDLTLFR